MSRYKRGKTGSLEDYELAWVVREIAKITDKPLREIGEALANEVIDNPAYSEYEQGLGVSAGWALEQLWYREGYFKPGPDADEALRLIKKVLNDDV